MCNCVYCCTVSSLMQFVQNMFRYQFSTTDLWLPRILMNSVNSTITCLNFCRFSTCLIYKICNCTYTHTHRTCYVCNFYIRQVNGVNWRIYCFTFLSVRPSIHPSVCAHTEAVGKEASFEPRTFACEAIATPRPGI